VRPFAIVLLGALLLCNVCAADAQEGSPALRWIGLRTTASIVVDRMAQAGPANEFRDLERVTMLCATFHNVDTRTVTSVGFTFVTYDGTGNRIGTQELIRKANLATGALSAGASDATGRVFRDNCITLRTPRTDAMTVFYYVDSVTFDDDTAWNVAGIVFPDRTIPGTRFDASASAVAPPLQPSQELAPMILGSYPDCATAAALKFPPATMARTVVVGVDPGAPISDGLMHIGETSLCRSSGVAARDAAALALIKQTPVAIVRRAAMTVFYPQVSAGSACSELPRILRSELVEPPAGDASSAAHAGEYTSIAQVDLRPDGVAAAARTTRSSGRSDFDEAARESALASRYWPQVTAGAPVPGTFDFTMRWVVSDIPNGRRTMSAYGPRPEPATQACLSSPLP
jgi:hypothetical protein